MIFVIDNVMKIRGRGKLLIGNVSNEPIYIGDVLPLHDSSGMKIQDVVIKGIEKFRESARVANVGEGVGLVVDETINAEKGMTLSKGENPQVQRGASKISELQDMLYSGSITKEEYELKKKELLGE